MNKKLHWKQSRLNGGYIQICFYFCLKEMKSPNLTVYSGIIEVSLFILGLTRWFVNYTSVCTASCSMPHVIMYGQWCNAQYTRLISHRARAVSIKCSRARGLFAAASQSWCWELMWNVFTVSLSPWLPLNIWPRAQAWCLSPAQQGRNVSAQVSVKWSKEI